MLGLAAGFMGDRCGMESVVCAPLVANVVALLSFLNATESPLV